MDRMIDGRMTDGEMVEEKMVAVTANVEQFGGKLWSLGHVQKRR